MKKIILFAVIFMASCACPHKTAGLKYKDAVIDDYREYIMNDKKLDKEVKEKTLEAIDAYEKSLNEPDSFLWFNSGK